MADYTSWLAKLRQGLEITTSNLDDAPTGQGLYVLWHRRPTADECLKVGIAGPRREKGLRERLDLHFGSNPNNSVLAKHMAADCQLARPAGFDFTVREERKTFLAKKCFFQTVELPAGMPRKELRDFEKWAEKDSGLDPRYIGRVKSRPCPPDTSGSVAESVGIALGIAAALAILLAVWVYIRGQQRQEG